MTEGGYQMVVDLDAHKCACKKWELSRIPCYHACACIAWAKKRFEPYIHQSYSFLECYSNMIEPISGEEEWTTTDYPKPLPPTIKVPTGRPKKKRNKATDVPQVGATKLKRKNSFVKCTYCTEPNHNTRTCPARAADRAKGCEKQVKTRVKKPKTTEPILEGDDGSQTPTTTTTRHTSATTSTKASGGKVAGGRPTSSSKTSATNASAEKPSPMPTRSKRTITRPSRFAQDGQSGVFTQKKKGPAPKNTPLGVQLEDFGDNMVAPQV